MSEIERIQESEEVRMIRALDSPHDQTAELGSDEGMTDKEMEVLHQTRSGVLPWERTEHA